MNKINKKTYKKIKELNEILTMLGLSEEDLSNFIILLKNYDNIVSRINLISKDVNYLTEKSKNSEEKKKDKTEVDIRDMYKELNAPARGNIYGK